MGPAKTDNNGLSCKQKLWNWTKKIFWFIIGQWLLIGFGVACVLGYYFPHVAAHNGTIHSEWTIMYGAVGLIFFISGLQLSLTNLHTNLLNLRLHLITQGISFFVIPAIILAIIHISITAGAIKHAKLTLSLLVGMVTLSCLPTTIASNIVMTRSSGGDAEAAIVEVILGNVFGAFVTPALVVAFLPKGGIWDSWQPASLNELGPMYAIVVRQLGASVVGPLAVGMAIRFKWNKQTAKWIAKLYLGKVSTFCLILLIWTTFSGAFETGVLKEMPTGSLVFDIIMNITLYSVFTLVCLALARPPERLCRVFNSWLVEGKIGSKIPQWLRRLFMLRRLPRKQTAAVCFCGAAKTTSLGIPLVASMWSHSDSHIVASVQIPVLLYTVEQVFMAQILVYWFREYIKRDEKAYLTDIESGAGEIITDQNTEQI